MWVEIQTQVADCEPAPGLTQNRRVGVDENSPATSEPPSRSTTGPGSRELLLTVWRTMRELFGQSWTSQYGATPSAGWRAALRGLSAEEIRAGLRAMVDAGDSFPPGAPSFRAMCRPPDRRTPEQRAFARRVADENPVPLSLERLAGGTQTGRRWLAYWWLRGIRPRPADVTMELLDEMLDGADVEDMDAQVKKGREDILHGMRHRPEAIDSWRKWQAELADRAPDKPRRYDGRRGQPEGER